MKWRILAAVAALGIGFSLYVTSSANDPKYDIDGNGGVTLGDVAAVLAHVGERSTPVPCVNIYRGTPDAQGYAVKIGAPAGHPIFAGDVRLIPC